MVNRVKSDTPERRNITKLIKTSAEKRGNNGNDAALDTEAVMGTIFFLSFGLGLATVMLIVELAAADNKMIRLL